MRTKHYSYRTEETYIDWVRRYILFHHKKHLKEMGPPEIRAFITQLAVERNVAASTQNQALSAVLFLYREVLHQEIEPILLGNAKRLERLPTVLTREEAIKVINQLSETHKLVAQLLYDSGLRLMECVKLRVKDLDFTYKTITVRDGKGEKDRVAPMPDSIRPHHQRQIERVRLLHDEDLSAGFGKVYLPNALEKKYPNAATELIWQYLFPAPKYSFDPRTIPSIYPLLVGLQPPKQSGVGEGSGVRSEVPLPPFPHLKWGKAGMGASFAATISNPPASNAPSKKPRVKSASKSELPVLPSVIPSQPTSFKTDMIPSTCGSGQVSAPFRNCSATRMLRLP